MFLNDFELIKAHLNFTILVRKDNSKLLKIPLIINLYLYFGSNYEEKKVPTPSIISN
jgi:hypothetical protein